MYHDINTILKEGCTLLLIAASYYEEELIKYLLDRGADATIHNYDGYTPLMALCESAKMRDYSNCSSLLIEVSNVDATDNRKMTALMYACKKGKIELVKQLIKHTKNINAEDIRGCTALFHAVLSEKIEVVKLLVDNKADTAIMNNENRTAEKVADSKGYHQISSFLSNEIDNPLNYKILSNLNWRYQFHRLFSMEDHCVNYDIYDYLNQLNLKCYVTFFRKMKLQIFLQLTEEDLINLKMNISVHRNRFLEFLNQFHCKPWDKMSLHLNLYGSPYTYV
ncbi:ankyrin repeat, SAM and basic leucine zipper domain-containing protein 1-like [Vespa mandarinia]|uniref:ankyrin repeat, SAM and basic leucine zipper domain-containing protein 1-like n=1 Tax=Vespa mandarinia TaxID=7446 RepID=UPI00161EC474|nr:ankyrin repeat, SAM and basic leucine zipper domain-containing protein 1-like [Vespa mandarinia]